MAYKSSPRPTFTGPAKIAYGQVTRHLWGDKDSGFVDDWIYISSDKIHQLVFGLPPGGHFKHSDAFRTIFAADEVLLVLSGTMALANPETGEVRIVKTGEAAFFRKNTWHNAFVCGQEELRVLEYFAPPPSTGSSGKHAKTRPYISQPRYFRPELLEHWPAARAETDDKQTISILREPDWLWGLDPSDQNILTGIIASTNQLTVGVVQMAPGSKSATRRHGGAAGLFVLEGRVNILLENTDEFPVWFELHPNDGFYIPEGQDYRLFNMGGEPAKVVVGVAPRWNP